MASIFGHIVASSALGLSGFSQKVSWQTLALAGFCAAIPDADVLGFQYGISYTSIWGHRGWTHSLSFALVFGTFVAWIFYRQEKDWWKMAIWLVLATASHPLLDMLTTGGMGCALWWPFSEERLFFPVQVIRVSPLEIRSFISKMGLRILLNEAVWIGIPSVALVVLSHLWRKTR